MTANITVTICFIVGCLLGGLFAAKPGGTAADSEIGSAEASVRDGAGVAFETRLRVRQKRSRPKANRVPGALPEDPVILFKEMLRASPGERRELAEKFRFADADLGVVGRYALYMGWVEDDPDEALNVALATDPDLVVREMIFARWSDRDLPAAAERYRKNPNDLALGRPSQGGLSEEVGAMLYGKLRRESEAKAREWVESLPAEIKSSILSEK